MDVIVFAIALDQFSLEVPAHLGEDAHEVADGEPGQGVAAIFGDEDQVCVKGIDDVPSLANICISSHIASSDQLVEM